MFSAAKTISQYLPVFLLLNSAALVALAAHAVVLIRSNQPTRVKIDQYNYDNTAPLAEKLQRYTNLLRYDARIHFLDIYATLAFSSLTTSLAWTSFLLDRQARLKDRTYSQLDLKDWSREKREALTMSLLDSALFTATLVLTFIVWAVHNDAEHNLDMNNPLLPKHHVNQTVSYGPISKDRYFTFETWNCALVPHLSLNHGPYASRADIYGRCIQLQALRHLILPLLVVSSIRAAISTSSFREIVAQSMSRSEDEAAHPLLGQRAESGRSGSKQRSPKELADRAASLHQAELSGSTADIAELPGSEAPELPGHEIADELAAEEVAAEVPLQQYSAHT